MADLILKVTPEQVSEKATQITNKRSEMDGLMSEMEGYVKTLSSSWNSTSGEEYVEKYYNVRREINDSLANLQTHVDHLNHAAQTYTELEQEQLGKVDALSANDIF